MTQTILKARTIQIYPNKEQRRMITNTFGCNRFLWNQMLDMQKQRYNHEPTCSFVSAYGMNYLLPVLKKQYPWLKEVESTSLQCTNDALAKAYKKFFKKEAKMPRFKAKHHEQSYTSKSVGDSVRLIDKTHIHVPKLGVLRCKQKKMPTGCIKAVTIRQKANGKYFASVLYKTEVQPLPKTGQSVGGDLGLKDFLILSNGIKIPSVRYDKKLEDKMSYWQRLASRRLLKAKEAMKKDPTQKLTDFKNYQKARRMVAKYHDRIANQRKNALHQLSTDMVRQYDTIVLEDLKIKNLMHNHKLARAISNASWNAFVQMLSYKCQWYGKELKLVNPAYTSQTCSHCGALNDRLGYDKYGWLKVRDWTCSSCGAHHDRDVNAAQNILQLGLA